MKIVTIRFRVASSGAESAMSGIYSNKGTKMAATPRILERLEVSDVGSNNKDIPPCTRFKGLNMNQRDLIRCVLQIKYL